jgi:hypothetical protein
VRRSKRWRSANNLGAQLPRAGDLVSRARFGEAEESAVRGAQRDAQGARAARRAAREAIWTTLASFGLVRNSIGPNREETNRSPARERVQARMLAVECP